MHTTEASRVVKVEMAQKMKLIKMSKINFYAQNSTEWSKPGTTNETWLITCDNDAAQLNGEKEFYADN